MVVKDGPIISVIMPSYNAAEYIEKSIQSVVNQTYRNWELIVVDDCSSDDTVSIVNQLARSDRRIRCIQLQKNSGIPAVPRNHALQELQGNWIAFLDADDLWDSNKLEIQLDHAKESGSVFIYTDYRVIDRSDASIGSYRSPDIVDYYSNLAGNKIGCLTVLVDRKLIGDQVFRTDLSLRGREDYIMWLQILKHNGKATRAGSGPLASYRIVPGSVSRSKIRAAISQWRVYRDVERLPLRKSVCYWIMYTIHGINKWHI